MRRALEEEERDRRKVNRDASWRRLLHRTLTLSHTGQAAQDALEMAHAARRKQAQDVEAREEAEQLARQAERRAQVELEYRKGRCTAHPCQNFRCVNNFSLYEEPSEKAFSAPYLPWEACGCSQDL